VRQSRAVLLRGKKIGEERWERMARERAASVTVLPNLMNVFSS
jgi:hypothetical protein